MRVFDNINNLPQAVIEWRLRKVDPTGVAETYSTIPTPENLFTIHNYVKVDSVLTDTQIVNGLSNPMTVKEQRAIDKRLASLTNAQLASALKTVTADEAETYIENTVTSLATAKVVMKQMARMIIALRDHTFSEIDV